MVQKNFHLHLISDSTGETVSSVARAALAQFEGVEAEDHLWSLVRTKGQLERVMDSIEADPGFVMYTLSDSHLRKELRRRCEEMNMPCVSVLSRTISDLSSFLGIKTTEHQPGNQYQLDEEYFSRVEAINFALNHDDGHSPWDLEEADIVLVGVSRTSKSPTSVYLAYKGYRVANIPYVKGVKLPENVFTVTSPLVVALTISPDRLKDIRKSRILSIEGGSNDKMNYVDIDNITDEITEVKRLAAKHKWPCINVTRKSVEEVAAQIVGLHQNKKEKDRKKNKP